MDCLLQVLGLAPANGDQRGQAPTIVEQEARNRISSLLLRGLTAKGDAATGIGDDSRLRRPRALAPQHLVGRRGVRRAGRSNSQALSHHQGDQEAETTAEEEEGTIHA